MRALAAVLLIVLAPVIQVGGAPNLTPQTRATLAQLESWGKAFAELAKVATPAVVNISTTTIIPGREVPDFWDPFDFFFGRRGRRMLRIPERELHNLGSGVIVSSDGYIVTNNHVIADADKIRVSLADQREFEAHRRGNDPDTDIAVLKVDATNLPTITWGNSDDLEVGEWVIAVGNPYGFSHSVTAGIVSAKGRTEVADSPLQSFIQTDAAINPGNSGGALLNLRGELVGINTSIFSRSGGYQGIGFAVPANMAHQVAEQLIREGEVVRGWIGVQARAVAPADLRRLGMTHGAVYIKALYAQQPAHLAGLRPGDVVLSVNGQPITKPADLQRAIIQAPIGEYVTVVVLRKEGKKTIRVQVISRPKDPDGRPLRGI